MVLVESLKPKNLRSHIDLYHLILCLRKSKIWTPKVRMNPLKGYNLHARVPWTHLFQMNTDNSWIWSTFKTLSSIDRKRWVFRTFLESSKISTAIDTKKTQRNSKTLALTHRQHNLNTIRLTRLFMWQCLNTWTRNTSKRRCLIRQLLI